VRIGKAMYFAVACASALPLTAIAQTAAAPATGDAAAVDPARLAAARQLIDKISPPAKRDAMIEGMMRPVIANMRQSFEQSPDFTKLFAEQPKLRDQMMAFINAETEHSLKIVRETMPSLFEAMAIAYARRFTTEQLAEVGRFFDTPTGRIYADQAPTIMSDPAVLAAQRAMMAKSFEGLQDRVKEMAKKIEASAKKDGAS
jgi:hypothetical protein